ncbi:MAG TPA: hypothetical protein VNE41_07760 [Chitinophagaceae bacterium]|nr:hypothetical protein [Chitinophagaceae bacterium]
MGFGWGPYTSLKTLVAAITALVAGHQAIESIIDQIIRWLALLPSP